MQHAMSTRSKLECCENYNLYQHIDLEIIETLCKVMTFKCNLHKNNNMCLYLNSIGLAHSADMLQQCTKCRPYCDVLVKLLIFN